MIGTKLGRTMERMPDAILPCIPGYEVLRFAGWGCGAAECSTHYVARTTASRVLVDLGLFPPAVWAAGATLRTEMAALARLEHGNIRRLVDTGKFGRSWYVAWEYADRTLADELRDGPADVSRALRIAIGLASALEYARSEGLVHGDFSPSGVFINDAGVGKLTSFYPAEIDRGPETSPAYMPPERLRGEPRVTPAMDVYRVGALLYTMLTAAAPFRAHSAVAVALQVMESSPLPPRQLNPRVPEELEAICIQCLEKLPHKRPPTLRHLVEALTSLAHESGTGPATF